MTFNSKYHGCEGICEGSTLIFPGFLIGFFFIPTKDPIKTKGVEQHNQSNNKANIVVKATAPLEPSAQRNKSIKKNTKKAKAGYKNAVNKELISQFVWLNIL